MGADFLHEAEIGWLDAAAEVVSLARLSAHQSPPETVTMVLNVEPVAYLPAVAIDGQRPSLGRVQEHQGNELLGELKGPVVVRAGRVDGRLPVGLGVGTEQVVG